MVECIAGLDIGGTNMKFGLVQENGRIIWKTRVPTPYADLDKLMDAIAGLLEEARHYGEFKALGIGCPGYADKDAGAIVDAANLALPLIPFRDILEPRHGLEIEVSNDVDVAMRAEQLYGVCRDKEHVVYVALGTGVGGGFIFDSNPYRGNRSLGGEIGHMVTHKDGRACSCGMYGCFEQYASVSALVRDVKETLAANGRASEISQVSGKQIFGALREGDTLIRRAYEAWLDELAIGLISLMAVLAPQEIVIGGGLSNEGTYFSDAIINALKRHQVYEKYYCEIEIKTAQTGNNAGIIGAASLHLKKEGVSYA